jgi:uncharacterized protein
MDQQQPAAPWWRHGYVWLVISGPAVVVVAALVTAWIAARSPDPVLAEEHSQRTAIVNKNAVSNPSLMPALQGRNHAAAPPPVR